MHLPNGVDEIKLSYISVLFLSAVRFPLRLPISYIAYTLNYALKISCQLIPGKNSPIELDVSLLL